MDVPWENLSKHFSSAIRFIKGAVTGGGNVFVHCYAGVSRSAAIVCAYLMQAHDMGMFQALSMCK
jgi:dual specificity phosphatase 12